MSKELRNEWKELFASVKDQTGDFLYRGNNQFVWTEVKHG